VPWFLDEACIEEAKAFNMYGLNSIVSQVAVGRVAYRPSGAAACLAGWATAPCGYWHHPKWPAACSEALAGHVANTGSCTFDFECAEGFCDNPPDCSGVCRPLVSTGQPCTRDAQCAGPLMCNQGACVQDKAGLAGEACGGSTSGGGRCEIGAFCDANGTCTPLVAIGGVCHDSMNCAEDSLCDRCPRGGSCFAPGTTGKCTRLRQAGEACHKEWSTDPDSDCASGLTCVTGHDGTTSCAKGINLGGQCKTSDQCIGETICGAAGTCVRLPAKGEPCGPGIPVKDLSCAPPNVCDWAAQVCLDRGQFGQPCEFTPPSCAYELWCANKVCDDEACEHPRGTCQVLPAAGEPCAAPGTGIALCAHGFDCGTDKICRSCQP